MPITTSWYDEEHKVISQVFKGAWTWEELTRESAEMHRMAASVGDNVILISDMLETSFMPRGNVLSQGRSIMQKLPDNITTVVIVIQSRMIEVFTNMALDMVKGLRSRIKFVRTMEEGKKVVEAALAANHATRSSS